MTYTIGIDTGGTFTDAFVADEADRHWAVKVNTTPHDLTVCFGEAINRCAEAVGLATPGLLRQTAVIRFSSTIGTNTILTRSGPKLGLLVTSGHEDQLYGAAEGGRIFEFLSARMVRGVDEEVDSNGRVVRRPDHRRVDEAVRHLLEQGARILVVSLQNAARSAENERAVLRAINSGYPRHYLGAVPTLLSTQVSAVADDASRTTSTVVNAYTHKQLSLSLYKAEDDLRRQGYRHPLLVVTGDGSATRVAKTRALSTYQSGPAAGVHASALLANARGLGAALTADVGGTSTDVGVVSNGRPLRSRSVRVGGLEVAQPSVDVFSIALGGGSIARVENGRVHVGPESAGSVPGPASFGLGGKDPTPTDAWLVLGYLSPGFYLGGRRKLQPKLAERALMEQIGKPLSLSVGEAALAVSQAAEQAAREGIEQVAELPRVRAALGKSGIPALVAYGGGGGILLPGVALSLGVGTTLLSPLAPVFSAFGVSTLDVRHEYEGRLAGPGRSRADRLGETLAALLDEAGRDLRGEGFEPDDARLSVTLLGEEGEVLLEGVGPAEAADALQGLAGGDAVALVSLAAECSVQKPSLNPLQPRPPEETAPDPERREVLTAGGPIQVPVHEGERLRPGDRLAGPVLVETASTTSFIPAGIGAGIDELGTAVLRRDA